MDLPDGSQTNDAAEAFERGRAYERHRLEIPLLSQPSDMLDGKTREQEFLRLIQEGDPRELAIAISLALDAAHAAVEEAHAKVDDALAVQETEHETTERYQLEDHE